MTQMNSFTKQKQIHRHRKKSLDYQRGDGVRNRYIGRLGLKQSPTVYSLTYNKP